MSTLLHLDSAVRPDGVTRALTARYAERWVAGAAAYEQRTVVYRDLAADPLPHIGLTPSEHLMYRTADEDPLPAEVVRCHELIAELRSADLLLLGAPMYNFTVPSTVKAWIDHIAWPGLTFDPVAGRGLLDVPAVVVMSRGGGYNPGTPKADFNFQEPYLTKAFEFLGITDVEFIAAELRAFVKEETPSEDLKALGEQSHADALARVDKLTPLD